jgi:prepilin-type N-terminal cleavage/methylation domain-containing protein
MKRSQGFTLIELLVVMAIAVILAGIGMTLYGTSVTRAKEGGPARGLVSDAQGDRRVLRR